MKNFPRQRLGYSQKISSNNKWAKDVMDHLLLTYTLDSNIINDPRNDYQRKLSNYQLFNNQINQHDFERECNPLGIDVGQYKDTIQPYNKTYNKIQVLLGEELRRPFNFKPYLINSEGVRSKLQYQDALYRNYVYSEIQKTIQNAGNIYDPQLLEEINTPIIDPKDVAQYMSYSYQDAREVLASKILNYMIISDEIQDKKNDAFKHALISGEEILYIESESPTPSIKVINPLNFFYHASPETKFIEDSLYAGYRTYLTPAEVLDNYSDYLTAEEIKRIDSSIQGFLGVRDDIIGPTMDYGHDYDLFSETNSHNFNSAREGSYQDADNYQNDYLVQHVEWRSQKKVGFLSFTNEYGDPQMEIVSEDFVPPAIHERSSIKKAYNRSANIYSWTDTNGTFFSLEWAWIPEVWTGTRIGTDIYCKIGPKKQQYRLKDDPYKVKLGYHGVVYNSMNASSISLMDRMKPFQYLYFIVMHKLKKLLAQEQGKVFNFDVTMVDPKLGLEKTMYYLKEMNINFYNPLMNAELPGSSQRSATAQSPSDMSNMQNILSYVNILQALDQQISEVAGVTRQREGQTTSSEAVSNAQANIQMSAIITEIYFHLHSKIWERALSSLVQATQSAWQGQSLIKQYVLPDLSYSTLSISPDDLTNWDVGVFVLSSGKEVQMFDDLKAMSSALLNTNRAKFSDLIKLYKSTSTQELEEGIKQSEKNMQEEQMQMQQQQIEGAQAQQQAQQQFELEKQAREHAHEIAKAEIESFRFQRDQDLDNNNIPDQLEVEKFKTDTALKTRKLDLEEKKIEKMSQNTPNKK